MKDIEMRRLEMFKHVRDFGSREAAYFPGGTYISNTFNSLAALVTEISNYFQTQMTQHNIAYSGTLGKAAAKSALYEELKAISRTAEIISRDTPEIAEKFRFVRKIIKDQELLTMAYSFAELIVPYQQLFISHEMAQDFLPQLNARIAVLETALKTSSNATSVRVGATAAIDDAIERGMDLVRRLDVAISNKFHNNKLLMQAWHNAKHVERARTSTAKYTQPQPTTDLAK